MRGRLLRTVIVLSLLIVTALLAANRYPDQLYHSWEWARGWGTILTTRNNYGFLAAKNPNLRFVGDVLAPPFMPRKSSAPPQLYTDVDGYEVFEAWLGKMGLPRPVMINKESSESVESNRCLPPEVRQRLAGALIDFAANNTGNWRFEFGRMKGHQLGIPQERSRSRSEVSFSAVGFNKDRTLAVLYATYFCGPLCARGTYYVLEKHNGQWDTVSSIERCGWIS